MSRWFRWYRGTTENPKFRLAARNGKVTLVTVMAVWQCVLEDAASENHRGICEKREDFIAAALDLDDDGTVERALRGLEYVGLLSVGTGAITVVDWQKWQYEQDVSDPTNAERQRRFKDRKRDENASVTGGNGRVTVGKRPDTDTDTDTEKKETTLKGASANEIERLENQCREAAGCETSPSPSLFDLSPIRRCLAGGASLEMDILPALRAIKARGKSISSWKYAEQPIMDAKASREAPAMAGNVTIPQPRGQPPPAKVSNNRRILDALNAMEPHDVTNYASHDGPVQISTARPVLDVQHGRQGRTG